jgi:hypothetical protein
VTRSRFSRRRKTTEFREADMKLKTMIFRVILALVLSSVVTIIARLVMEIIIPSNVQNTHNVSALALSIISP